MKRYIKSLFFYRQVFRPNRHLLRFKSNNFDNLSLISLLSSYKWLFLHYETKFSEVDLRFCEIVCFGLCMAFLAFMVSKNKNTQAQGFLLPLDHTKLKKIPKISKNSCPAFVLAFKNFWPFFNFSGIKKS